MLLFTQQKQMNTHRKEIIKMDENNREETNNVSNNENGNESYSSSNEYSKGENRSSNYVFWAEEAASSERQSDGNQTNGTASQYEAPNYETNYNQGPVGYGSTFAASELDGGKKKKEKKPGGIGKKATKFVACAVAFGLIAGLVFQGVNRTADSLFPTSTTTSGNVIEATTPTTYTSGTDGTNTSTDLTELVANTMPSIVSITSTMSQDYSYFGQVYSEEYDGSGSGIIVGQNDSEILIVTNNHVVDGAKAIAVNFINDKVYEAKVKGTDSTADLAVVAVETKDVDEDTLSSIKIATLGNSDDVKVGQMAVAIGNALGSGQSVTVGYISAKDRLVNTTSTSKGSQLELLQTDAAINPGNSGGALLNINGEVIGINDMKYMDTGVEGMGYAIPISAATPIINELMNREILDENEKGYLGISGTDITAENNAYDMPIGVYVHEVADGGAAQEGGIKKGDIITAINDAETKTIEAVQEKVNSIRAGTEITVTIMRNVDGEYKEMDATVTLKDSSILNKLTSTKNNTSADNDSQSGQNDADANSDGSKEQVPNQDQDGDGSDSNSQTNQDINDQLQQFFNQFGN